ncbi:MAG: alpha/beta fold hydrolase [Planctomycetota bacterium]|nr:alpha/beta fold hydrolase [Planctomycetota bacterium]
MRHVLTGFVVVLACAITAPAQQEQPQPPFDPEKEAVGVVELLVKEEFAAITARFDATMKGLLTAEQLQQGWKSLLGMAGPLVKIGDTGIEKSGETDVATVVCEFKNCPLSVRVVFNAKRDIAGLLFMPVANTAQYVTPDYARPESYTEKEVTVGSGEWALPGTLTMPKEGSPHPAIVLVHGSGPHDRDETIGPNRPFRDLAFGLATLGIAVLRYEKRTKAHGEKFLTIMAETTVKEEVTDDALAAVALLRKTEGIDAGQIFLLGHSLGAMLAPRIAEGDPTLAGIILMAGPTRPLEDLVLDQTAYILGLDGELSKTEEQQIAELRKQAARVKDPGLSPETPAADLPLRLPPKYWLSLRGYRPEETAARLKLSMLILQGERDYQVTTADFACWKKSLAGRTDVELRLYPALNHLFIAGEGKCTPVEYSKAGHVDAAVVGDIAAWILKR